ncbi:MAG TPA: MTH938/NDUFAF3 family protein [Candidatus Desulfaltia sp.]|nr:MTH938/NDUFAF3 family protein [Candidatus Desulfaltia sp.]
MIEHYEFGRMRVDGRSFLADLIILPQMIRASWWRQEGHRLVRADLEDVFREELQVLVVGTGFFGLMKVDEDVKRAAREKGLELHVDKTKKAAALFNRLAGRKRTAGAFHLTC